ncbi:hypothetical protein IE53DRAFT_380849 [Violaceomyces palustris]|uniref:Uncharacterized protein n=1 Tax=Violaceomyces palustris TaxID=1673888 RepID=A0ACD0NT87_9BASI|nr:hypothetical protein IE53DRAFT_380849 [Violaceomyces palustris]
MSQKRRDHSLCFHTSLVGSIELGEGSSNKDADSSAGPSHETAKAATCIPLMISTEPSKGSDDSVTRTMSEATIRETPAFLPEVSSNSPLMMDVKDLHPRILELARPNSAASSTSTIIDIHSKGWQDEKGNRKGKTEKTGSPHISSTVGGSHLFKSPSTIRRSHSFGSCCGTCSGTLKRNFDRAASLSGHDQPFIIPSRSSSKALGSSQTATQSQSSRKKNPIASTTVITSILSVLEREGAFEDADENAIEEEDVFISSKRQIQAHKRASSCSITRMPYPLQSAPPREIKLSESLASGEDVVTGIQPDLQSRCSASQSSSSVTSSVTSLAYQFPFSWDTSLPCNRSLMEIKNEERRVHPSIMDIRNATATLLRETEELKNWQGSQEDALSLDEWINQLNSPTIHSSVSSTPSKMSKGGGSVFELGSEAHRKFTTSTKSDDRIFSNSSHGSSGRVLSTGSSASGSTDRQRSTSSNSSSSFSSSSSNQLGRGTGKANGGPSSLYSSIKGSMSNLALITSSPGRMQLKARFSVSGKKSKPSLAQKSLKAVGHPVPTLSAKTSSHRSSAPYSSESATTSFNSEMKERSVSSTSSEPATSHPTALTDEPIKEGEDLNLSDMAFNADICKTLICGSLENQEDCAGKEDEEPETDQINTENDKSRPEQRKKSIIPSTEYYSDESQISVSPCSHIFCSTTVRDKTIDEGQHFSDPALTIPSSLSLAKSTGISTPTSSTISLTSCKDSCQACEIVKSLDDEGKEGSIKGPTDECAPTFSSSSSSSTDGDDSHCSTPEPESALKICLDKGSGVELEDFGLDASMAMMGMDTSTGKYRMPLLSDASQRHR